MPEQRVNILIYRPDGTLIAQYLLGDGEHLIGHGVLGNHHQNLLHAPHPTPPVTPAQGLMPPSSETCIRIAKALKGFHGEE